MKISVVVPTHQRTELLEKLIQSIRRQSFEEGAFELIVVPNLPDRYFQSENFLQAVDGIDCRVVVSGTVGVNVARNKGIAEASGEVLLLLDDDCFLDRRDYLTRVYDAHQRHRGAIAIGGAYRVREKASPCDLAYNCISRQWQSHDFFGEYQSTRLVGGNVSYKVEMLQSLDRWFDESIKFGGTEAEFHTRLHEMGQTCLYLPSLEVLHNTSLTLEQLANKAYQQARGRRLHKIEEGYSNRSSQTYQSKRLLLARERAQSQAHFNQSVHCIELYDFVYNYSLRNPDMKKRKLFSKVNKLFAARRSL